jgi:2-iminoacetate synthase
MFSDFVKAYDWDEISQKIKIKTPADVERALQKSRPSLEDFMAMISPAAEAYLEEMAQLSHRETVRRFGKTIQMFAPMYLSNECQNICTYCGFSLGNKVPRKTLNEQELLKEFSFLKKQGFEHVLLVTGEDAIYAHASYITKGIKLAKQHFSNVSVEVQPLGVEEYKDFAQAGCDAVLVYQETYNRETYKRVHPKGKKSNYDFRVNTPDRLGEAGIHKIGIGALLGLDDWRTDSFFMALHLSYLEKKYWKSRYSISFPRLRPADGVEFESTLINDRQLVQLICALRLFNSEIELSLSTREPQWMRDNLVKMGVTTMSAGSKTNPGGYEATPDELEQFEISDERSPEMIAQMIASHGYEAVWKDWDKSLTAYE